MTRIWREVEGPTWLVAIVIYGGWAMLAIHARALPAIVVLPLAIYVIAWHSSLQHETIHALRCVPRPVRSLLAIAPLGVWFPYQLYRREHLRHHATHDLAGPTDPESFYHAAASWSRMNAPLRALFALNQSLLGRLLLGPALQIGRAYWSEMRRFKAGDRSNAGIWAVHVALVTLLLAALARCGIDPWVYLGCVAYPAASLTLVRSFAEHRYTASIADRTAIVESRSLLSLLFLNNNLHAVHHRHPTVAWFDLPRVHTIDRARKASQSGPPTIRGYRTIAKTWLLRGIDSPVAEPAYGSVTSDMARRSHRGSSVLAPER